jgi:hypothetical protein
MFTPPFRAGLASAAPPALGAGAKEAAKNFPGELDPWEHAINSRLAEGKEK